MQRSGSRGVPTSPAARAPVGVSHTPADRAELAQGRMRDRCNRKGTIGSFRRDHAPSPFDYTNGRKGRTRWPGFLTRGSSRNGDAFPCSTEHSGGHPRRGRPCGQRVGGRQSAAPLLAYSGGTVWVSHPLPLAAGERQDTTVKYSTVAEGVAGARPGNAGVPDRAGPATIVRVGMTSLDEYLWPQHAPPCCRRRTKGRQCPS